MPKRKNSLASKAAYKRWKIVHSKQGLDNKKCSVCKKEMPLTSFYSKKGVWDKLRSECKKCSRKIYSKWRLNNLKKVALDMRKWKIEHPDKAFILNNHHGLTLDQFNKLLEKQNGVCKICNKSQTMMRNGQTLRLYIDHNHETKKVRSLLCHKCNVIIGLAHENSTLLREAADYLDKWKREEKYAIHT